MPVTPEQHDQLQALNTSVNVIPYVAGQGPTEPVDYWTYKPEPGKSWVCRDYTEDKAQQLREAGWSPLDLTVMLLWTEPLDDAGTKEYHAMLAVQVDTETWMLDSRFTDIYQISSPPVPYTWDRRQIPGTTEFQSVAA